MSGIARHPSVVPVPLAVSAEVVAPATVSALAPGSCEDRGHDPHRHRHREHPPPPDRPPHRGLGARPGSRGGRARRRRPARAGPAPARRAGDALRRQLRARAHPAVGRARREPRRRRARHARVQPRLQRGPEERHRLPLRRVGRDAGGVRRVRLERCAVRPVGAAPDPRADQDGRRRGRVAVLREDPRPRRHGARAALGRRRRAGDVRRAGGGRRTSAEARAGRR